MLQIFFKASLNGDETFKIPGINTYKNQTFQTFDAAGITNLEACHFNGSVLAGGVVTVRDCQFADKVTLSGAINIFGSKFIKKLNASGTVKIADSELDKASIKGSLHLDEVTANHIDVKSDEITLEACKVREIVIRSSTDNKNAILRLRDACSVERVIFENAQGEIRADDLSKIGHIVNGAKIS